MFQHRQVEQSQGHVLSGAAQPDAAAITITQATYHATDGAVQLRASNKPVERHASRKERPARAPTAAPAAPRLNDRLHDHFLDNGHLRHHNRLSDGDDHEALQQSTSHARIITETLSTTFQRNLPEAALRQRCHSKKQLRCLLLKPAHIESVQKASYCILYACNPYIYHFLFSRPYYLGKRFCPFSLPCHLHLFKFPSLPSPLYPHFYLSLTSHISLPRNPISAPVRNRTSVTGWMLRCAHTNT